jgi:hypothetical protein
MAFLANFSAKHALPGHSILRFGPDAHTPTYFLGDHRPRGRTDTEKAQTGGQRDQIEHGVDYSHRFLSGQCHASGKKNPNQSTTAQTNVHVAPSLSLRIST